MHNDNDSIIDIHDDDDNIPSDLRVHHWLSYQSRYPSSASSSSASSSLDPAIRADSPLLGFPNLHAPSHDPLHFPSPNYVRDLPASPLATDPGREKPLPAPPSRVHTPSSSLSLSRRPSTLARQPSLPLLGETSVLESPPSRLPVQSRSRSHSAASLVSPGLYHLPSNSSLHQQYQQQLHPPARRLSIRSRSRFPSISSALSVDSPANPGIRNAVYFDSEEVRERLDAYILSRSSEDDVILPTNDEADYPDDASDAHHQADHLFSSPQTPLPQRPPSQHPNTPMGYHSSSSQIYLGPGLAESPAIYHTGGQYHKSLLSTTSTSTTTSASSSDSVPETPGTSPVAPGVFGKRAVYPALTVYTGSEMRYPPRGRYPYESGHAHEQHHEGDDGDDGLLVPPPAIGSRWSLTSSLLDLPSSNTDSASSSPKVGKRRRLVSFISRLSSAGPHHLHLPAAAAPTIAESMVQGSWEPVVLSPTTSSVAEDYSGSVPPTPTTATHSSEVEHSTLYSYPYSFSGSSHGHHDGDNVKDLSPGANVDAAAATAAQINTQTKTRDEKLYASPTSVSSLRPWDGEQKDTTIKRRERLMSLPLDVPTSPRQSPMPSPCSPTSSCYNAAIPVPAIPSAPHSSPVLPTKRASLGLRGLRTMIGLGNSHALERDSVSRKLGVLTSGKRRLVISGVGEGDAQGHAAVRAWCEGFGEVRQMERKGNGCLVVDFRKASVANTVCRVQAQVYIKGAGSVSLSWYSKKKSSL